MQQMILTSYCTPFMVYFCYATIIINLVRIPFFNIEHLILSYQECRVRSVVSVFLVENHCSMQQKETHARFMMIQEFNLQSSVA